MSDLELIHYPDPRLRKVSTPVKQITVELLEKVREMFPVMYEAKGIGLAAPQVGWNVRLFTMNTTGEPQDECVLINPEILERAGKYMMEEGCLSLPEIRGKFERPKKLRIKALFISGEALKGDLEKVQAEPVEMELDDLPARCIQHELDHLDGILIIDKFSPAKKQAIKARLRELEDEFAGTAK